MSAGIPTAATPATATCQFSGLFIVGCAGENTTTHTIDVD
jgi:hypothetical protein